MVAHLAAAGYDVVATGRNKAIGAKLTQCTFIPADLTSDILDPLVQEVDIVFHLAALSSPWGKRSDFERANILATQRLLETAQASGASAFIFASTPSIYTDAKDQLDITEQTPLPDRFANDYATTKYVAEQLVLAHQGTMHTVALRPRAIVGPYDTALLPRLIRASKRGLMPLPGKGEARIELTDARDVAAAFLAASERAAAVRGRAFNISGGAPRRLRDLASQIFTIQNRNVRFLPLSATFVTAIGDVMERIAKLLPSQPEPPLTRYSAMALGWSQTFDLKAAQTALNWAPYYTPEQAIEWALEGNVHG